MRMKCADCGKGQMKIQQMAFMIVAVFFFFILVGLFFLGWQYKSIRGSFESLEREQAIASLRVISDMSELNCDEGRSLCLDYDKLEVMASYEKYDEFWPVESVKIYQVYPPFSTLIKCPAKSCNYWEIYDSEQEGAREYSTFVNICKTVNSGGYVYEDCELGKLVLGVRVIE